MGYYTNFNLSIKHTVGACTEDMIASLENEIERMNVFESGTYKHGYYAYEKWYDFDYDMLILSHRFPNFLFTLYGDGEESDDFWVRYYQAGRSTGGQAELRYPVFNPNDLKSPGREFFIDHTRYEYQEEDCKEDDDCGNL